MYLWDIPDLIKDLRNNTIPEWKIRMYYALSPALSLLNGFFFGVILLGHHLVEYSFKGWLRKPHPSIEFYNYWGTTFGLLTVFIAFFGMYLCYRANKKGDGKDFWERMACLSFPINFHITMYALAILTALGLFAYFFLQAKITAFQYQLSGAPLIALPFLSSKVNKFANKIRALILMFYPILALVPAILSFIHYAIVRSLIKEVAEHSGHPEDPYTIDHESFDPFD